MSHYAENPFDHLAPFDGPYPTVAMPHPFNKQPVFSTIGRGPRGKKGDPLDIVKTTDIPDFDPDYIGQVAIDIENDIAYIATGSNSTNWKQITN